MHSDELMADPFVAAQPESLPFWQAAERGELLGKRCVECSKFHWYPRSVCPFCSGDTEWQPISGHGRIYAFSTLRRASPPYIVAIVELDEGPRMLTRLMDADAQSLKIGMPVRVRFTSTGEGRQIPVFDVWQGASRTTT